METKICSQCKIEKILSDFNKRYDGKNNLRSHCKECQKKNYKQWHQKNLDKQREKKKQYRQQNSEKERERKKIYRQKNAEKIRDKNKIYRKVNAEKIRDRILKYKYGISLEEYNLMFERQNGCCLICKEQPKKGLVVDHSHNTGKVRGLLCNDCNTGIGLLKETPQFFINAIEYLQKFSNQFEQRIVA